MASYPKNISLNKDPKSNFWYVSFLVQGDKQRRKSTKVPVSGGMFDGGRLSSAQAKNRALIEGTRIAQEACKKEESVNNISLRRFLNEYYTRRRAYVALATAVNMEGAYRRLCDVLGKRADLPINEIKRDDAKRFVEARRIEVRSQSVRKDVACICAAFNDALDGELIVRNPFSRIKVEPDTSEEELKHEAFSLDEIRFMIEKFPERWSRAVRCSFETYGQRLGDVLALKWGQFDFTNRVVKIKTGKTGKELEQPMRDAFHQWALTHRGGDDEFVMPDLAKAGNPSAEFGAMLRFYQIGITSEESRGKRRKFNSKSFHSIRATCATLLQSSGVSMAMSMRLVGHDSEDIHKVYVRPDADQLRQAANSLPEL